MKRRANSKRRRPWFVGAIVALTSGAGLMYLRRRRKTTDEATPQPELEFNHVAPGEDEANIASMGHA